MMKAKSLSDQLALIRDEVIARGLMTAEELDIAFVAIVLCEA